MPIEVDQNLVPIRSAAHDHRCEPRALNPRKGVFTPLYGGVFFFRRSAMRPGRVRPLQTVVHVLLAVVGGYGCIAALVPTLAILANRAGMVRSEATVLAMMLGFFAYLLLLLWAFSTRLARLLMGLLVSTLICVACGWLLR